MAVSLPSSNSLRPSWRFAIIDLEGQWGWKALTESVIAGLQEKLRNIESMTWQQILQGTGSHPQEGASICSRAKERLREIEMDDSEEELFSIRLTGKARIWGIREDGGVMKLLWWDPDHTVLPVSKKNT